VSDEAEINKAIGRLEAMAESGRSQRVDLFKQTDEIKEMVAKNSQNMASFIAATEAMLAAHNKDIETLKEDSVAFKKFRNRVHLAIAGTFGSGGVGGYILSKLGMSGGS